MAFSTSQLNKRVFIKMFFLSFFYLGIPLDSLISQIWESNILYIRLFFMVIFVNLLFRFFLYVKLSLVMGVTWIMEIVSYFVGGSDVFWILPDVLNALQGIIILVLLCWNKQVMISLNEKLYPKYMFFKKSQRMSQHTLSTGSWKSRSQNVVKFDGQELKQV